MSTKLGSQSLQLRSHLMSVGSIYISLTPLFHDYTVLLSISFSESSIPKYHSASFCTMSSWPKSRSTAEAQQSGIQLVTNPRMQQPYPLQAYGAAFSPAAAGQAHSPSKGKSCRTVVRCPQRHTPSHPSACTLHGRIETHSQSWKYLLSGIWKKTVNFQSSLSALFTLLPHGLQSRSQLPPATVSSPGMHICIVLKQLSSYFYTTAFT